MPDCVRATPPAAPSDAWQASLNLGFADDAGTTRLVERSHCGPLRVQKPLYPEGRAVCHAIMIHPPGGVVGGDQLATTVSAGAHTHVLLATPGATKWYRAHGKLSRQQVRIDVGAGASVEWLPQESIFFDQAQVTLSHQVELAADASYIGCDIICLGRRASGEAFTQGAISQHSQIRRGGKLLWWEQGVLTAGGERQASPLGLHGHSVCATLIAVGQVLPATLLAGLRALEIDAAGASLGATHMKNLLVLRYLGDDSQVARRLMMAAWQQLRPHLLGRPGQVPRIWNT